MGTKGSQSSSCRTECEIPRRVKPCSTNAELQYPVGPDHHGAVIGPAALGIFFVDAAPVEPHPGLPGQGGQTLEGGAAGHLLGVPLHLHPPVGDALGQGGRPYNCTMVIRPDGTLAAKYRKLHPFDVTVPGGGQMRESSQICPGDAIVTVDAGELGTWGLSVCYDLRFGELYRIMALEGAQVLFVPANFTLNTGKDHWEVLLRARAIENGCYVVAPEQFGPGPEFPAYGRSMVVDPWGNVVAQAPDRPGVILADIDLDYVEEIRRKVGTLANRRADRYRLERV